MEMWASTRCLSQSSSDLNMARCSLVGSPLSPRDITAGNPDHLPVLRCIGPRLPTRSSIPQRNTRRFQASCQDFLPIAYRLVLCLLACSSTLQQKSHRSQTGFLPTNCWLSHCQPACSLALESNTLRPQMSNLLPIYYWPSHCQLAYGSVLLGARRLRASSPNILLIACWLSRCLLACSLAPQSKPRRPQRRSSDCQPITTST